MAKAKSRLQNQASYEVRVLSHEKKERKVISHNSYLITRYVLHLPTLILSIPFYLAVGYIIITIHPSQIRHLLIPNTYLPLQVALFLGNFFFFTFIFLKTRRGFLLSLFASIWLFLQLEFVYTWIHVATIFAFLFLLELVSSYFDRK